MDVFITSMLTVTNAMPTDFGNEVVLLEGNHFSKVWALHAALGFGSCCCCSFWDNIEVERGLSYCVI